MQFTHSDKPIVSVFQLLYNMAGTSLQKSNKLQELKEKQTKVPFIGVYRRILWSKLWYWQGRWENLGGLEI